MPVEFHVTFTCDRCGKSERVAAPSAGKSTPPPRDWKTIMGSVMDFRIYGNQNHNEKILCAECSTGFRWWWQEPLNEAVSDVSNG